MAKWPQYSIVIIGKLRACHSMVPETSLSYVFMHQVFLEPTFMPSLIYVYGYFHLTLAEIFSRDRKEVALKYLVFDVSLRFFLLGSGLNHSLRFF